VPQKGIGKAIAQRMVKDNYITILVDIDTVNGKLLAKELNGIVRFISCDICNADDVENLFNTVMEEFGHVDVLVNNAELLKTM